MRIVEQYSHLNGLEFILVHKKKLWKEINDVIEKVDGNDCKTKVSKEKTMPGRKLSPKPFPAIIKQTLLKIDWQ